MRIAFFVNSLKKEATDSTTIRLAMEATNRGHQSLFIEADDFLLDENDCVMATARIVPRNRYRSSSVYLEELRGKRAVNKRIKFINLDVLFLRGDPVPESRERRWTKDVGIYFGKLSVRNGVLVVNDPDGLSGALNESYLDLFPEAVRPVNIITRKKGEVKKFAREREKFLLRPLRWSPDNEEFLVTGDDLPNLNQIVESLTRDGYVIAQEFLEDKANPSGYTMVLLLEGSPLLCKGKAAAIKVIPGQGRGSLETPHLEPAILSKKELRCIEQAKPKLLKDGMFFAGLKIVNAKIMEIDVFCPSYLSQIEELLGSNFARPIIKALEKKV